MNYEIRLKAVYSSIVFYNRTSKLHRDVLRVSFRSGEPLCADDVMRKALNRKHRKA